MLNYTPEIPVIRAIFSQNNTNEKDDAPSSAK